MNYKARYFEILAAAWMYTSLSTFSCVKDMHLHLLQGSGVRYPLQFMAGDSSHLKADGMERTLKLPTTLSHLGSNSGKRCLKNTYLIF